MGADRKRIPFDEMQHEFLRILLKFGFTQARARLCAEAFAENSLDGVNSHGVNRFSHFIDKIKTGHIVIDAVPERMHSSGALEQWNGNLGPGPLNALACTDRAVKLAQEFGLGCVALSNTNHWMRGGTYGWRAATNGYIFCGWSNTEPNLPAWGAKDCRLGNNPIVLAVPKEDGAIVLDMALSQFSYGKLHEYSLTNLDLPVPGGFTENGQATKNANQILSSHRPLAIGYWKKAKSFRRNPG